MTLSYQQKFVKEYIELCKKHDYVIVQGVFGDFTVRGLEGFKEELNDLATEFDLTYQDSVKAP